MTHCSRPRATAALMRGSSRHAWCQSCQSEENAAGHLSSAELQAMRSRRETQVRLCARACVEGEGLEGGNSLVTYLERPQWRHSLGVRAAAV